MWVGLAAGLTCAAQLSGRGAVAHAGTVRGQLSVAAERSEPSADGLWRIDNGILPVVPRAVDLHGECMIVLVPQPEGHARDLKKEEVVTAEVRGLRLSPQVITLPFGAAIEIKNEDPVPHALTLRLADETILPSRETPAGAVRSERIQRPGTFELRDDEQPHLRGWVIVTDGGAALRPDEHGAFKGEVPDGRYLLRVFARGGYAIERAIEVGSKPVELQLTVPARGAAADVSPKDAPPKGAAAADAPPKAQAVKEPAPRAEPANRPGTDAGGAR